MPPLASSGLPILAWGSLCLVLVLPWRAANAETPAQEPDRATVDASQDAPKKEVPPQADVLPDAEWRRVNHSIERSLAWLVSQQRPDGSFPTLEVGQPAVTSLCTMAFLANGHTPGEGPYGEPLARAVRYVLRTQRPNGVIAAPAPGSRPIHRVYSHTVGKAVAYNHAISGLLLSETYGMLPAPRPDHGKAIRAAIEVSLTMQRWPKKRATSEGGWRYAHDDGYSDADLSITGWHLMFLRSAKNAGFDVDEKVIEDAVGYVRRCYSPKHKTFRYYLWPEKERYSRAMAGAGVLALAHAGRHHSPEANAAGDWILRNGFEEYNVIKRWNQTRWFNDRYHYGILLCSQAMYQLGGDRWHRFYPQVVQVLLGNQQDSGAWQPEAGDTEFGEAYPTALATLALSAPNQLLPIFQR